MLGILSSKLTIRLTIISIAFFNAGYLLAQTAPVSPADSATAAAAKGGGQVVKIDGIEYTFSGIATLPRDQRSAMLKKLGEIGQLGMYQTWRNELNEAANQRLAEATIREQAALQRLAEATIREQAAIQRVAEKEVRLQAAINDIIQKIPQIIPVYEAKISSGQKLSTDQQKTLEYILSLGKPPEWMPRIQKLLANLQNFSP